MHRGRIYRGIVEAVKQGRLSEPFTPKGFQRAVRGLATGTYTVFLSKHRKGNPGGNSELFQQVGKGLFGLLKPTDGLRRGRVYRGIVDAIGQGKLKEPFTSKDFRRAIRGLGEGTYSAFLHKHRRGNPGGNSQLFQQVGKGLFRLLKNK